MGTRAYLTREGTLVATQGEAGLGFTKVDIPYGKAEQLQWINEFAAGRVLNPGAENPCAEVILLPSEMRAGNGQLAPGQCPMCHRYRDEAERAAAVLNQGDRADVLVEAILEADQATLNRLSLAFQERGR